MASPKLPESCSAAAFPDPEVKCIVQVLDYHESLVRTPSETSFLCVSPCPSAASSSEVIEDTDHHDPLATLDSPFPIPSIPPTGSSNRRMNVDEIRALWNHKRLYSKLGTHETCIDFAEQRGMVPTSKMCGYHRRPMSIAQAGGGQLGRFRCRKMKCRTKGQSRAAGTWFEHARLPLPLIFELMYAFSHNNTYETVQRDTKDDTRPTVLSDSTISDWYSQCRETIVVYELENQSERSLIGGPRKNVYINESKFGKRKYNSGHHLEGHWVLGIVEEGCSDLRVGLCLDNEGSSDVLEVIKKHVMEGSTVHTDLWQAYDCLSEHGFTHKKENRLVAPGLTNQKYIQSPWHVIKRAFHRQNNRATFADWVTEFAWRRRIAINRLDPFEELLTSVVHVYKIK